MSSTDYVHGYSAKEAARLGDQASALNKLIHSDTVYPPGSRVLEAGCGVGAQTLTLAANNPEVSFTAIDISNASLEEARRKVKSAGFTNVDFQVADIFDPPFPQDHFDHVFVCFTLEHLPNPADALRGLSRILKPGGSMTVIEGDQGSSYFHPESQRARRVIQCLVDLQSQAGADPLIGRRLYPLLIDTGYRDVSVSPRMVYVDDSKPALVEGFTRKTFIAMVEGVRAEAIDRGLIDESNWDAGIRDLKLTAAGGGTFCYTFFKATALR